MDYELIIVIINRGFSDDVMDAAREAGATGGTILNARGSGSHKAEEFFGIAIQPEKELVMILVPKELRSGIMTAVCGRAGLNTPGKGIVFSLPVSDVLGLSKQETK